MKRFISGLLVVLLMMLFALPVQAGEGSGILIDGRPVHFDVEPQVIDGVLMVPIRAVAEAMQGSASWHEPSKTATIASGHHTVVLTVGRSSAMLNGREVMLSGKVTMVNGRTFVPASFLLIFYGDRLQITHPAVRDPRVVKMLLKSAQLEPTHYDTTARQEIHMTDGIMTVDISSEVEEQVRGEEMLLETRMQSLMLPPGAGDVTMALRDGKQYVKTGGVWEEVPGPVSTSDLQQPLMLTDEVEDPSMLNQLIVEAHFGETHMENRRLLQDLVITYDLNQFLAMFGDELVQEGSVEELSVERYMSIITIDVDTGAAVAQKVDMAFLITAEGTEMRVELKMESRLTPNQEPIVWPADLKF